MKGMQIARLSRKQVSTQLSGYLEESAALALSKCPIKGTEDLSFEIEDTFELLSSHGHASL